MTVLFLQNRLCLLQSSLWLLDRECIDFCADFVDRIFDV